MADAMRRPGVRTVPRGTTRRYAMAKKKDKKKDKKDKKSKKNKKK
jgi:hypothetical protein